MLARGFRFAVALALPAAVLAASADPMFHPPAGWTPTHVAPPANVPQARVVGAYRAPYLEGGMHPGFYVLDSPGSVAYDFATGIDAFVAHANGTDAAKGQIVCKGRAANWTTTTLPINDGLSLTILEIEHEFGVRLIMYGRPAGSGADAAAMRALRHTCDHAAY